MIERDLFLQDHPAMSNGLVDGKWALPEGISIAFGLKGFDSHME